METTKKIKARAFYLRILTLRPSLKLILILLFFLSLPLLRSTSAQISFEPQASYASLRGLVSIAAGDLNKDGFNDVVTGGFFTAEIGVYFNKGLGDSKFRNYVDYINGGSPYVLTPFDVQIADVNKDSWPDIITSGGQAVSPFNGHGFSVFINNADRDVPIAHPHGNVTFAYTHFDPIPAVDVPNTYGTDSWSIVTLTVADFNGDGNLDVAAIDSNSSTLRIYRGNGDGTFDVTGFASYNLGLIGGGTQYQQQKVISGDFNNDGKLDLAVENLVMHTVSIFLGNGNATFNLYESDVLPGYGGTMISGDFNGDGKLDLAIVNHINLLVYLNSGQCGVPGKSCLLAPASYNAGNSPTGITAADFNHDGISDLAVSNLNDDNVSVLINNGDGTFGAPSFFSVGMKPGSLAAADFDNFGNTDLAVANEGNMSGAGIGASLSVLLQSVQVTDVTSTTADGSYKAGVTFPIQVKFNKAVNVTGTPQLALNSGGTANYSGGTGTDTLTFNYTVLATENSADLDYSATGSLTLNGGTIKNHDNLLADANLALPAPGAMHSLGNNKNLVIDTAVPVIAIIAPTHVSGTNIADTTIHVTDDHGILASQVTTASSTVGVSNFICTQTNALTVDCTIDITSATAGNLTINATDMAGNSAAPQTEAGYTISMVAPTIVITAPTKVSNVAITNTTIHITDSDGVLVANVTTIGSTAAITPIACTQTDANTVDCTISITGSGDLTINATDNLSNLATLTETGYVIDAVVPVIAINLGPSGKIFNANITDTTIHVTDNNAIVFSNVTIDTSTTATADNLVCLQTDIKTVDCTIRITASGNLVIKAIDAATNQETQAENGYVVDTIPPVITITAPTTFSNAAITDTTIRVTDDQGITAANVLTTGSTAGIAAYSCSNTSATQVDCTLNITSSGDLTIVATDNATNTATQTEAGYVINLAAPTVQFTTTTASALESVTPANLQVSLSALSGTDIFVNYAVTGGTAVNGVDYALLPGRLTIPAGQTSANIVIPIVDDNLENGDRTIIVTLLNSPNAGLGANTTFTYTILDNDTGSGSVGLVPAAVSPLTCQATANDAIDWNFHNVANALGFNLYRPSIPTDVLIKQAVGADLTQIKETGLANSGKPANVQYSRLVKAYNASGQSLASNTDSCFTLANKPNQVIIASTGPGQINLKLDPNDGNPPATLYAIKEFNTNQYLQADGTLGATETWLTYAQFGGNSGLTVNSGAASCFAAKAKNGDNIETVFSDTANNCSSVFLAPALTANKSVANLSLARNGWVGGLVDSALAAGNLILPTGSTNSWESLLREFSFFLNIILLILLVIFGITLYRTIRLFRRKQRAVGNWRLLYAVLTKEPAHVFNNYSEKSTNGSYTQSYDKHKKLHALSQQTFKQALGIIGLKIFILAFIFSGVFGLNHNSLAQNVTYDQDGRAVSVGDNLNYKIEVTNNGTAAANAVMLEDDLNSNLSLVAGSAKINKNGADTTSGITQSGQNLSFDVGSLAPAETATIYLTAQVKTGSSGRNITNFAEISGNNFIGFNSNTVSNQVRALVSPAVCGNGIIETGEVCDRTGCPAGEQCNSTCSRCITPGQPGAQPICGNGIKERGEACDGTACPGGEQCNSICQCVTPAPSNGNLNQPTSFCGNGIIETGETCEGASGCTVGQQCVHCQCETPLPSNTNVNQPPLVPPATPPGEQPPEIPIIGPIINNIVKTEPFKTIKAVIINPEVKKATRDVVVPLLVTVAVVNTVPAIILIAYLLPYLHLLFFEPFLIFFRKKRNKWGVVYNSLTKLPVDLALVRLYDKQTNMVVQTKVTDRKGRYIMIAREPGQYYLAITRPGFIYPTNFLSNERQDNKFLDLYHGEAIEVKEKGAVITANIPVDPVDQKSLSATKVVRTYLIKNLRMVIAYLGLVLSGVIVLIYPAVLTIACLAIHLVLFSIFTRLLVPSKPKSWGIVYDQNTKQPLGSTVVRIFDTKFNKLLETQVTDSKGRYSFLVGQNEYQLLTEKPGYQNKEIKPVDLVNNEEIVNQDIGLIRNNP